MGDEIENQNVIRVEFGGLYWTARIGPDGPAGLEGHGTNPVNAINALTLKIHFNGYVFDATPPQVTAPAAEPVPAAAPKPVATPVPTVAPGA